MAIVEIAKIQVRRGEENVTGMPQLSPGEFGWAEDTENLYIGKRVAEGAVDDSNTRILTTNDLGNIFARASSGVLTTTSTYQYRTGTEYISADFRTIQSKLDDTVSLADYGVIPSSTATDITPQFKHAIADIFFNLEWNSFERHDARRVLMIPAGNYTVSDTINLPPYTRLEGQGRGLTTITMTTSDTSMFKTVDADGNGFETNDMRSGVKRAREVTIKGMTLQYSTSTTNTLALLSLDNVENAVVEDVLFRTAIDDTSTSTYGLVSSGVGIAIRGSGDSMELGDVNLAENILIDKCEFDSLAVGVAGTGTVVRPMISNSVLNNLGQGITMHSTGGLLGPTNGVFKTNRFTNIVNEGIYVGAATNRSTHTSEDNFFVQVGNGSGLDDTITTSSGATSVIGFLSEGNKTINDYFHRQSVANTTSNVNFYYNPLVAGKATLDNPSVFVKAVPAGTVKVAKLFVNGSDQLINVRYQLSNANYSRKGNLTINIVGADSYGSISDYYDYSYITSITDPLFEIDSTNVALGYVELICINAAIDSLSLEYQANILL